MLHRASNRTFLVAAWSSLAASALVAAWIGLRLGGARTTLWVDDRSGVAAAALACASCLIARGRYAGRANTFWLLLSCATALWAFAEVVWAVYALLLEQAVPSPSIADLGYLLAVPITLLLAMAVVNSAYAYLTEIAQRINAASSGVSVSDGRR